MDYVQDLSSPLRIRSRMSILFWSFQLFAAAAFLILDVAFRVSIYFILVPRALFRYVFNVKPKPKPHPTEAELDLDRSFYEFAESRGFTVQEHTVETDDGYLLTLHRLLPKNYRPENLTNYPDLHDMAGVGAKSSKKKAYLAVPCRGVVLFSTVSYRVRNVGYSEKIPTRPYLFCWPPKDTIAGSEMSEAISIR